MSPRREGLHAVFIAMEACWIAALILVVEANLPGPHTPGVVWALALYPVAYGVAHLVRPHRWQAWWNLAAACVLGIPAIAVVLWSIFPDPLTAPYPAGLIVITGGIAWARGWLLSNRAVDLGGFAAGFQLGVFLLLVVALVEHLGPGPTGLFAPLTAAFFALGLIGLRFARVLENEIRERFGTASTILAVVGIVLVVAGGFVARSEIDRALLELLLAPLFWLWDVLGQILLYLISLLPPVDIGDLPIDPAMGNRLPPPPDPKPRFNLFKWMHVAGGIMFYSSVAYMFGMILFQSLFRLLRWLQRRRDPSLNLSIEKSEFGFMDEIRALFAALADLLARLRGLRLRFGARTPAEARTVRGIYRRLLSWAAMHGFDKRPDQTAHEFQEALRPALPDHTFELRFMTEAYSAARYGTVRPDPSLLTRFRSAWRRLRAARPHRTA